MDLYDSEVGNKVYVSLSIAVHWLSMSNSFVNPVIYCFMSDNFRVSDRRFYKVRTLFESNDRQD